jgi:hypothetical protein
MQICVTMVEAQKRFDYFARRAEFGETITVRRFRHLLFAFAPTQSKRRVRAERKFAFKSKLKK